MSDPASKIEFQNQIRRILSEVHLRYRDLDRGEVAAYIPELAKADPKLFGISIVTVDGDAYGVGHAETNFTIQSAINPFVYGLMLEKLGSATIDRRVGVEPSGNSFNSIGLDPRTNAPFNAMANPGAITLMDLVPGDDPTQRLLTVLEMVANYVGHPVEVDMAVYSSEKATGHRNRAIANLLLNFNLLDRPVEEVLNLYFQACSIRVSCRDLATMGATLANRGVNPCTGHRAIESNLLRNVLSVMYTCGMYEIAGQWAHQVGLPAKSGVGGGLVVVVPGMMGIAVFSPLLDASGAPARGIPVLQDLSHELGLHMFHPRYGQQFQEE